MENNPLPIKPKSKKPFIFAGFAVLLLVLIGTGIYLFLNQEQSKEPRQETKVATESSVTKQEEKAPLGYVTAEAGLNLRQEPSLTANIILLLPFGTEVEIVASQGDWYLVNANAQGFVSKEFISNTKPTGIILKVFKEEVSPFNFLYPDIYQVSFKKTDNVYEYNFSGNQSFGGFKVEAEEGHATLGNYALKNYPGSQKSACEVQFGASRKECEQVQTSEGTIYLVLFNTTLYKISYLRTEGGLFTDINNLIFFSLVVK